MQKVSIQTQDNVKSYLDEISKMKVSELEFFCTRTTFAHRSETLEIEKA